MHKRWSLRGLLVAASQVVTACGGGGSGGGNPSEPAPVTPATTSLNWERMPLPAGASVMGTFNCGRQIGLLGFTISGFPPAWLTSDQGATWTRRDTMGRASPVPGSDRWQLISQRTSSGAIATSLSADCGQTLQPLGDAAALCLEASTDATGPVRFAQPGADARRLLAYTANGAVCHSEDGGLAWTRAPEYALPNQATIIGRDAQRLYAAIETAGNASLQQMVVSSDGGRRWTASGIQGARIGLVQPGGAGTRIVAVSARAPATNDLQLWTLPADGSAAVRRDLALPAGIAPASLGNVVAQPTRPTRLLVSVSGSTRWLITEDGQDRWQEFATGLPLDPINLEFDPADPSVLHALSFPSWWKARVPW